MIITYYQDRVTYLRDDSNERSLDKLEMTRYTLDMNIQSISFIIVLIISIIIHELAHGYAADSMGDPTPRLAGRLTMNPLAHIDWFGSVLLPAFLVISGSPFLVGWAKPVPFNPYNLRNKKWGGALVAIAGPLSNIGLAVIFALVLKFVTVSAFLGGFFTSIVVTNIALAVFNLVPIPPLDGHHILYAILGNRFPELQNFLRKYSMVVLVFFVIYGWKFISPIIWYLSRLLLF